MKGAGPRPKCLLDRECCGEAIVTAADEANEVKMTSV